jgi:cell division protein FtsZ
MGVLVHFSMNPDFPLTQVQNAMDIVYDSADEDADVIFGTTTDKDMPINMLKITIVATGFENSCEDMIEAPANNTTLNTSHNTSPEKSTVVRVGSGNSYILEDDDLDYPTFLRRQMD